MNQSIAVIRIALSIIAERLLLILSLSMSFTLACWTLWGPSWERFSMSAFFAIFSYAITRLGVNHETKKARTEE